jgi:hypothetical protein
MGGLSRVAKIVLRGLLPSCAAPLKGAPGDEGGRYNAARVTRKHYRTIRHE